MAVVVGCGGSGTDSRGTTTGVAGTDASAPTTVNLLAKPGQIELSYLTGQGRVGSRADGDVIATVGVPQFRDNTGTPTDLVTDSPPLVQLNSYQNQIYRINVPIVTIQDPLTNRPVNSREFDTYPLTVNKLRYTLDGSTSTLTSVVGLPITLPTKIRVFPGRYTSVPVYLNDAQFPITSDDTGTFATFNRTQFDTDNSLDTFPSVPAFLSDYLAFDISGLTDAKPVLNGKSGVSRLARFDCLDFKVNFGGEVRDFRPEDYFDSKEVKRLDRFSQFAVAAAGKAIKQSQIDFSTHPDPYRCGVIVEKVSCNPGSAQASRRTPDRNSSCTTIGGSTARPMPSRASTRNIAISSASAAMVGAMPRRCTRASKPDRTPLAAVGTINGAEARRAAGSVAEPIRLGGPIRLTGCSSTTCTTNDESAVRAGAWFTRSTSS
jgi:hypothetical protein